MTALRYILISLMYVGPWQLVLFILLPAATIAGESDIINVDISITPEQDVYYEGDTQTIGISLDGDYSGTVDVNVYLDEDDYEIIGVLGYSNNILGIYSLPERARPLYDKWRYTSISHDSIYAYSLPLLKNGKYSWKISISGTDQNVFPSASSNFFYTEFNNARWIREKQRPELIDPEGRIYSFSGQVMSRDTGDNAWTSPFMTVSSGWNANYNKFAALRPDNAILYADYTIRDLVQTIPGHTSSRINAYDYLIVANFKNPEISFHYDFWDEFGWDGPVTLYDPAVGSDGSIYVADEKFFRCLDSEGNQRFRYPVFPGSGPIITTDGNLVLQAGDPEMIGKLTPDGELLWTLDAPVVLRAPLVAGKDDTIYGVGAIETGSTDEHDVNFGAWWLFAISHDGTYKWILEGDDQSEFEYSFYLRYHPDLHGRLIIRDDDAICYGSFYGLFCVSPEGEYLWKNYDLGRYPRPIAAAPGGRLYVQAQDAESEEYHLYIIGRNGDIEQDLDMPGGFEHVLVDRDGSLYVFGEGALLYAIYGPYRMADTPWPTFRHDPQRSARAHNPDAKWNPGLRDPRDLQTESAQPQSGSAGGDFENEASPGVGVAPKTGAADEE